MIMIPWASYVPKRDLPLVLCEMFAGETKECKQNGTKIMLLNVITYADERKGNDSSTWGPIIII